jgi:hypothetical protein
VSRALIIVAVAAGCARPHYLGAAVPQPCTARDVEGCLGWMLERDLHSAELGIYDDAQLRTYVQRVVDRLARSAQVDRAPRVVIADQDETYATAGRRIVIGRTTLEKLGSEAELAGVLAHELAHIEGRHLMVSLFGRPITGDTQVDRRDSEAIADERAVWLLERAGYAPVAMGRALRAVLTAEDDEHPLRADRIARVEALAAGRGGFEGRDELLRQLDRMVVGRDPRLGRQVGDVWVVPALGIALEIAFSRGDELHSANDLLAVKRGGAALLAYAIGTPWARELIDALDDRDTSTTSLGRVTTGTVVAARASEDLSPLGKLAHAIRSTLPQPPVGTRVAILERPRGALVLEVGGSDLPRFGLRSATPRELATARPIRIAIERAPRAGTLAEVGACPGRLLDDPARRVAIGDRIKCADRAAETRSGE